MKSPVALLCTSVLCLLSTVLAAKEIPVNLPKPDPMPPDRSKPVKVYILSGQSNMVGMGTINVQSRTAYKTFQQPNGKGKGCVVSIYRGKYNPAVNYADETPVKTVVMNVGSYPHKEFPEIEGDYTHIARGYIRIEASGHYEFKSPSGPSIVKVDGETIYHHAPGTEPVMMAKFFEKGVYPIEIIHYERGWTNLTYRWADTKGALETLVKGEGKFPHLLGDDGNWAVRNDVWYRGLISAVGNGPLEPEVSAGKNKDSGTFGPELGFGHVMGYYHDEPVLIIKSSEGNRSLAWDFLPPGSQRYTIGNKTYAGYMDMKEEWETGTTPQPAPWYAGKQYDDCFSAVHEVLNNFSTEYPQFASQGYEIAGFVWWQGHKDSLKEAHASRYEHNMVQLIKQLRSHFKAPDAPFVVATIGFHGDRMDDRYKRVFDAQMAIGDPARHPEFNGSVVSVDTRPFWRDKDVSPQNQDYHYNRNAETYYLVGEAMGRAMARLQEAK